MEELADLSYPAMHRPLIELVISWSLVWRPNYCTTEPPTNQFWRLNLESMQKNWFIKQKSKVVVVEIVAVAFAAEAASAVYIHCINPFAATNLAEFPLR